MDLDILAHNWGAVALRGLAALAFGVIALVVPGFSLMALVIAFCAYTFIDGVLSLVSAIRGGTANSPWWVLAVQGVASIAVSVCTLFWPGITTLVLVYLIAAWAVVTGVIHVLAAIRLRKLISNEWLMALSGLVSIALGIALMMRPGIGALALVMWVGAYAVVGGALLFGLSLRLRHWHVEHPSGPDLGRIAHQH